MCSRNEAQDEYWERQVAARSAEHAPIPADINELRAELFATSRRMGRLKAELARRQREAQRVQREMLESYLKHAIENPDDPTTFTQ